MLFHFPSPLTKDFETSRVNGDMAYSPSRFIARFDLNYLRPFTDTGAVKRCELNIQVFEDRVDKALLCT